VRPSMLFGNFQIINICVVKCLEKRCREIIEPKLNGAQCGFCSTTDQIFTLQQNFENSWKYAKDVYTCFVDFKKAYDRVPREKLWGVLWVCGVDDRLLLAIKSLHSRSEVCVRVGRVNLRPITVGVGLRQGCVLSPSAGFRGGQGDRAQGPHHVRMFGHMCDMCVCVPLSHF